MGSSGGCVPPSIPDLPEVPDGVDIVPAPYGDVVAEMGPVAHLLAEELKAPQPEVQLVSHGYRGHYSFRQEQRTPDTPNLARPEEVKVLLLLHDGLAHDPAELASRAREARCIPGFFFRGIYLGNNPQEEAAMRGLLGADRLIACWAGELHLKFGNVLWAFRPVGV
jgi:hypothetical protein